MQNQPFNGYRIDSENSNAYTNDEFSSNLVLDRCYVDVVKTGVCHNSRANINHYCPQHIF